ncbi:MAG: GNAT family N-acetyltransferase [Salinivirgaceae bacterium]
MIYYQEKLLVIRTWQPGDEPFLAHHANNYNIWKYVMDLFPHPYTYDDALSWVELQKDREKPVNFALVYDGEPVGNMGLIPGHDVYKKNLNIGYWLSEEYWGRGIATQALLWFIPYVLKHFEPNRLAASVFSNNKASMQVLIKCGFKQEAVLKNAIVKAGQVLDEHIFTYNF